jgi:hypothetical protein
MTQADSSPALNLKAQEQAYRIGKLVRDELAEAESFLDRWMVDADPAFREQGVIHLQHAMRLLVGGEGDDR